MKRHKTFLTQSIPEEDLKNLMNTSRRSLCENVYRCTQKDVYGRNKNLFSLLKTKETNFFLHNDLKISHGFHTMLNQSEKLLINEK